MKSYTEREGSEFVEHPNGLRIEYRDASHRYFLHHDDKRVSVPSVTGVLKVLDKPQLTAWKVAQASAGEDPDATASVAADRGVAVHTVLEQWGRDETVPDLSDFPEEVRGYVQGLCRALLTLQPKVSSTERLVGSLEHGYAGRLDMRAVVHGRDCVIDLKTNRKGRVYDEAHLQARAYAIADVECGGREPDGILLLAVGEDGSFEVGECEASAEDWLSVLRCYQSVNRLRKARIARRRDEQEAKAA